MTASPRRAKIPGGRSRPRRRSEIGCRRHAEPRLHLDRRHRRRAIRCVLRGVPRRDPRHLRFRSGVGSVRGLAHVCLELRAPTRTAGSGSGHDDHPGVVAGKRRPGPVRKGRGSRGADPRRTIRRAIRSNVHHGRSRRLPDHDLREGPTAVLATEGLISGSRPGRGRDPARSRYIARHRHSADGTSSERR